MENYINYNFLTEQEEKKPLSCDGCIFHRQVNNHEPWKKGCFSPKGEPYRSCKSRHVIFVDTNEN